MTEQKCKLRYCIKMHSDPERDNRTIADILVRISISTFNQQIKHTIINTKET